MESRDHPRQRQRVQVHRSIRGSAALRSFPESSPARTAHGAQPHPVTACSRRRIRSATVSDPQDRPLHASRRSPPAATADTPMSTDTCTGTGPLAPWRAIATASPIAAMAIRSRIAPSRYARRPPSNPSPIHTASPAPPPRSRGRSTMPCPSDLPSAWASTFCACNEQPASRPLEPDRLGRSWRFATRNLTPNSRGRQA